MEEGLGIVRGKGHNMIGEGLQGRRAPCTGGFIGPEQVPACRYHKIIGYAVEKESATVLTGRMASA